MLILHVALLFVVSCISVSRITMFDVHGEFIGNAAMTHTHGGLCIHTYIYNYAYIYIYIYIDMYIH